MNSAEKTRFESLYRRHLRALKLQGMSDNTIDVYSACRTPDCTLLRLLSR